MQQSIGALLATLRHAYQLQSAQLRHQHHRDITTTQASHNIRSQSGRSGLSLHPPTHTHILTRTPPLLQGLEDMTRARDGLQRVPLMKGIGAAVFVYDITRDEMSTAASRLLEFGAGHGDEAAVHALLPRFGVDAVVVDTSVSNNVVPFPMPVHSFAAGLGAASASIDVVPA